MSDQHERSRKAWVRGEVPEQSADEFDRHAASGRKELADDNDAEGLLAELDNLVAKRYGEDTNNLGAAAGAKEKTKSGGAATVRRLRSYMAIAATLLLLLAAGWWWSRQSTSFDPEATYLAAFEPYANDLAARPMGGSEGDSASVNRTLAAATLAYDRRDYALAADSFAVYLNPASRNPAGLSPAAAPLSAKLYYGISLLGANRPEEAIAVLAPLLDGSTYGKPAAWYLALAQIRSGKPETARVSLLTIAGDTDSPFRKAAENLLNDIP